MLKLICLTGILCIAALTDLLFRKVRNLLILSGLLLGAAFAIFDGFGTGGLSAALLGTLMPLLLFPLFALGQMGAGDIKLLMVMGCFLGPAGLLGTIPWILGIALVFCIPKLTGGASMALRRAVDCPGTMKWRGAFGKRLLLRCQAILLGIISERRSCELLSHRREKQDRSKMIPLAPAMLLGFILWTFRGRMIW